MEKFFLGFWYHSVALHVLSQKITSKSDLVEASVRKRQPKLLPLIYFLFGAEPNDDVTRGTCCYTAKPESSQKVSILLIYPLWE